MVKEGTRVEVRNRFDGAWATGFALEDEGRDETGRPTWRTVRRVSDGMVIPQQFRAADVRRARGRSPWWY
jgi:hypothetical protein